ncbi:MAG: hypothetical protein R2755_17115 [Acidimicrobiales bacterium]
MSNPGAPIDKGRLQEALALRGGACTCLAGRRMASVFIRLGGALLLTDLLGVTDFGRYAGAMALVGVIGGFAMVGTDVYLIHFAGEPSRDTEDQAFVPTRLHAGGRGVGLVLSIGLRSWYDDGAMVTAFTVLLVPCRSTCAGCRPWPASNAPSATRRWPGSSVRATSCSTPPPSAPALFTPPTGRRSSPSSCSRRGCC